MRTLGESLDAFRAAVEERFSHGTTAFEHEAEVEEMLRNVRRIHCSFINDYEVRVACSLQIAWPKDV
jgi:hypothetical protein